MTVFCQRGVARCEGRPPLMDPARPKFIDKFLSDACAGGSRQQRMHASRWAFAYGCKQSSGGFMVSVSLLLK